MAHLFSTIVMVFNLWGTCWNNYCKIIEKNVKEFCHPYHND